MKVLLILFASSALLLAGTCSVKITDDWHILDCKNAKYYFVKKSFIGIGRWGDEARIYYTGGNGYSIDKYSFDRILKEK